MVVGLGVALLVDSEDEDDVKKLGLDVLERVLQRRRALRAIDLPSTQLAMHHGRGHLLFHKSSRPQGDGELAGI